MLRQYGFVPEHTPEGAVYEVFEDFGSSWEALVVQASPQVVPVLIAADCWLNGLDMGRNSCAPSLL